MRSLTGNRPGTCLTAAGGPANGMPCRRGFPERLSRLARRAGGRWAVRPTSAMLARAARAGVTSVTGGRHDSSNIGRFHSGGEKWPVPARRPSPPHDIIGLERQRRPACGTAELLLPSPPPPRRAGSCGAAYSCRLTSGGRPTDPTSDSIVVNASLIT